MIRATPAIATCLMVLWLAVANAQSTSGVTASPTPEQPSVAGPARSPSPTPTAGTADAPTPEPGISSSAVALRIEQIPPLIVQNNPVGGGWAEPVAWLGLLAAIAAIVSTVLGYRGTTKALAQREGEFQKSVVQRTNESEIAFLQEKLDKFYGPYLQLSETNKLLANEFRTRQPEGDEFRTLTALLNPKQRKRLESSKNDWTIVSEIVRIDRALDRMIQKNAGLVDSEVQKYLARVSTHFRIIRLAYANKLCGDPNGHFSKYYVYTRQVDRVLELEIKRLQDRCKLLREQLTAPHPPLAPLDIPADLALDAWPDPRNEQANPPTVPDRERQPNRVP